MPKYKVTDPTTGRSLTLTGDSPPTEQELEEIFATVKPKAAPDTAGASGSWAPPPSGVQVGRIGHMAMPATANYVEQNGGNLSIGKLGAMAGDVVSSPRRLFGAGVELAQGNPAGARQELEASQSTGVLNSITREAPLMLIPGGQVQGARAVGRIGKAVVQGAKEAIPSAVLHQLENKAEGGNLHLGEFVGELGAGGAIRSGLHGLGELGKAAVGHIKTGISKLSEVSKEAMEEAAAPLGGQSSLERFKEAGKKFGTQDGINVMPIAEDLSGKVQATNAGRLSLAEGSRATQVGRLESDLVGIRKDATGRSLRALTDLSADDAGTTLKIALEGSKKPMQTAFEEGDKAAYGGLRMAPALQEEVKRIVRPEPGLMPDGQGGLMPAPVEPQEVIEKVSALRKPIDKILTEYKALKPDQGISNITEGAEKGIKWIRGLADQAKTVDDLVSLKGKVRGLQAQGGFEGALFDATRDDRALAQVLEAVHQVEKESIRAAAPKRAGKIIQLVEANNAKYGQTLETLRKGDMRFRATQNSERIIGKIKEMGPEEARALMSEAEGNRVLQPYVTELRNGFVDDLLMSALDGKQVSPKAFAKEWGSLSDDLKQAWLTPQIIARIDDAVAKGTAEIKDPELVGQALFGKSLDLFQGERKISNIATEAQKKALAEMQMLDALFGSEYTEEALAAFRAKQLQITPEGKLPGVGSIRTGKAQAVAAAAGAAGASAGAAVAGPAGAAVGGMTGYGLGFYLQSPAGALAMFRALNRLEATSPTREAAARVTSQAVRSGAFGDKKK